MSKKDVEAEVEQAPEKSWIPRGLEEIEEFLGVSLLRYRAMVTPPSGSSMKRFSYEVWYNRAVIRRFIWIDWKSQAKGLARSWMRGFGAGLCCGRREVAQKFSEEAEAILRAPQVI